MKYRVLQDIQVEGDQHKAGDVLRCEAAGSIKAMLRAGQIEACEGESDFECWAKSRGIKIIGVSDETLAVLRGAFSNETRLVTHYERQLKQCGDRLLEAFEDVKKLQADKAALLKQLDEKTAPANDPPADDKTPPEGDKPADDKPPKKKADQ